MDYQQQYPRGDTLGAPGPQPGQGTLGRPPAQGPVQSPPMNYPPQGGPQGYAAGQPGGYPPSGAVVPGPWPGAAPGPQPGAPQPGWQGGNPPGYPQGPQGGFPGPTRPSTIPPSGAPGYGQPPAGGQPWAGQGAPRQGGAGMAAKATFHLITPECTLSYPNLFQPRQAKGASKAKYSCVLVFDPGADLRELWAAIQGAAMDRFGPQWMDVMRVQEAKQQAPLRRGELKNYPPGSFYLQARSDFQPGCVSRYRGPDGKPMVINDPGQLYAGARVRAAINAYAFDTQGNRGVAWGLNNLQKMGDGPRLDNRKSAQDQFEAFDEAPADFGPMAGAYGAPPSQWGAPPPQQWGAPPPPQNWQQQPPPPQQQWGPPQQQQWPQQGPVLGPGAPWQ